MPLILPSNSISAVGYEVDNSLRFNSGSSDNLSRTAGTGNRRKFTKSLWIKRSKLGISQDLFGLNASPNYNIELQLVNNGTLTFYNYNNSATTVQFITNRLFRDTSAWYHIVIAVDTEQATEANRFKLYVNGIQETSFSTANYPSLNEDLEINNGESIAVGAFPTGSDYFDGYMAEVCFIDGQALDPTSFGEFSEDENIWKPIDVSGLTFGTNGFYLDFENSGSLGADVSGNGNNFTVNNLTSIDQSTDTCTNNFATINPLDYSPNPATLENGNLSYNKSSTGSGHNASMTGTLGVMTGKWYYEFKPTNTSAFVVGMIRTNHGLPNSEGYYSNDSGSYSITNGGKIVAGSESSVSYSYSANDIFGMAYDLDNGKFYFHVNGTYINSGDPTSGSTGTGSLGNIALGSNIYVPFVSNANYDQTNLMHFNFGSPPYSISSGNSDGNGYGNFEYSVPSGYYALNTKNLAEYG